MRKPEEYKYYSTQRPISIGTFPKDHFKAPIRLQNYDGRLPVEGGAFRAWGEVVYDTPLSEGELRSYELRPSRNNPDIRRQMDAQAQVVGKWEDAHRVPDQKRLTWFYPDFGSYVVKEYVTPEQLAELCPWRGTPGGGAGPQGGQTPAPDCGATESGPTGGPGAPGPGRPQKESP